MGGVLWYLVWFSIHSRLSFCNNSPTGFDDSCPDAAFCLGDECLLKKPVSLHVSSKSKHLHNDVASTCCIEHHERVQDDAENADI